VGVYGNSIIRYIPIVLKKILDHPSADENPAGRFYNTPFIHVAVLELLSTMLQVMALPQFDPSTRQLPGVEGDAPTCCNPESS
jgi:hypothetical protein